MTHQVALSEIVGDELRARPMWSGDDRPLYAYLCLRLELDGQTRWTSRVAGDPPGALELLGAVDAHLTVLRGITAEHWLADDDELDDESSDDESSDDESSDDEDADSPDDRWPLASILAGLTTEPLPDGAEVDYVLALIKLVDDAGDETWAYTAAGPRRYLEPLVGFLLVEHDRLRDVARHGDELI